MLLLAVIFTIKILSRSMKEPLKFSLAFRKKSKATDCDICRSKKACASGCTKFVRVVFCKNVMSEAFQKTEETSNLNGVIIPMKPPFCINSIIRLNKHGKKVGFDCLDNYPEQKSSICYSSPFRPYTAGWQ